VAQLYRHWVPILVAFYDMHGLQWDCSLLPATTREGRHFALFKYFLSIITDNGSELQDVSLAIGPKIFLITFKVIDVI
jgi:hypothetical protein